MRTSADGGEGRPVEAPNMFMITQRLGHEIDINSIPFITGNKSEPGHSHRLKFIMFLIYNHILMATEFIRLNYLFPKHRGRLILPG